METGRQQAIFYRDLSGGPLKERSLRYDHFNLETDKFPYADNMFDYVLFCEIIEHMANDPLAALLEIKRVMKPGGLLILTTPNVARLENVVRLILGQNLYAPYSGYGPYGRHNREYTRHELYLLLKHLGFVFEKAFTADVHRNYFAEMAKLDGLKKLFSKQPNREYDLGQYIFLAARNANPASEKRPSFLYRSYAPQELTEVL